MRTDIGTRVQQHAATLVGRPLFWVLVLGVTFGWPIVRTLRQELPEPPPVLGRAPDFELVRQDGRVFSSRELAGRVFVATLVCTRCPDVAPELQQRMFQIQHRGRNLGRFFHIVSFAVDPDHDTPERLAELAVTTRASPRMWSLLTGPAGAVKRAVEGLQAHRPGGPARNHDAVLVDDRMRIRGYYDLRDDALIDALMRDVGILVRGRQ
jgi:protein SCO1/2